MNRSQISEGKLRVYEMPLILPILYDTVMPLEYELLCMCPTAMEYMSIRVIQLQR